MARGESPARIACKQEACPRRDVGPERGSTELPGRARHQQAPVGGGGSIPRRWWGARCADYAGHRPSSVGYDPSYDPDNEMSNSDGLEETSTSSDDVSSCAKAE